MPTNELSFPVNASGVAVPTGADTVVLTTGTPGTFQNLSLSNPAYQPSGVGPIPGTIGVALRGTLVYTHGGVAGTVTVKCKRNANTQIDANSSQPITVGANGVVNIPFEFIDSGENPEFQGSAWFYTITVQPSGSAGTVNRAYVRQTLS